MEKLVREMLHQIIENKVYDEQLITTYFSPQYVQVVNDTVLDFEGFKKHIKKLKEVVHTIRLEILQTGEGKDCVFTKHKVEVLLNDQSTHTYKVMAEFLFQEGKIIRCEELTYLVEGEASYNLGAVV
jgi:DNA-binding transcriptional MocR family regulator